MDMEEFNEILKDPEANKAFNKIVETINKFVVVWVEFGCAETELINNVITDYKLKN